MARDELILREVTVEDAVMIAALTVQLGYELEPEEAGVRIAAVLGASGHHAFGAFSGDVLLGYLHCYAAPSIDKGLILRVQALVVDEQARGSGAGRTLMAEAERLARQLGCSIVTLSSNERRTDAHAFYERIGCPCVLRTHRLSACVALVFLHKADPVAARFIVTVKNRPSFLTAGF